MDFEFSTNVDCRGQKTGRWVRLSGCVKSYSGMMVNTKNEKTSKKMKGTSLDRSL